MTLKTMPEPMYHGNPYASVMETIMHQYEKHSTGDSALSTAERYVMGYPLPEWQRELVWNVDQCTRFLESAWVGLHLGIFVVNRPDWQSGGNPVPFSGILIDGQQRLYAVEQYLNSAFPVFDAYWSDLDEITKRRFGMISFAHTQVAIYNEEALRDLYDRLNFGGTPHTEEQHASIKRA